MPNREEVLVSAVPLMLTVQRAPGPGAPRIEIDGFDPIAVTPGQRIVLRPEGHGVVLERETLAS